MEQWKSIKGYEGYYLISSYGNLKSEDRFVNSKGNSKAKKKGRIKKAGITNGYRIALLSRNGKEKGFSVHRLVAIHFVKGRTVIRNVINHIDGDRLNNHYTNLEWCTQKENIEHSHKYGLQNPIRGEKHHYSKISDSEVSEIRKRVLVNLESRKSVSELYNVSYSSICRICKGTQRVGLIQKGLAIDINTLNDD